MDICTPIDYAPFDKLRAGDKFLSVTILTMSFVIGLIIGLFVGGAAMYIVSRRSATDLEAVAESLSAKTMAKQVESILHLAETKLSGKKEVIDGTLKSMKDELEKVEELVQELEKDREQKFGQLNERLQKAAEVTKDLQTATNSLKTALSSNSGRGQWGERMAEDVLRLSGLVEGINYIKQKKLEAGSKPDFTFLLPKNLKLNMDVKFPFNNYQLYTEAKTDKERDDAQKKFLSDVKNRIKEVQTRDYINSAENTVDYVLLFIPNEQVFSFINEIDRTLVDDAMKARTILCSPLSLYAILAVIRQSIDSFSMEKKTGEMQTLFRAFREQWEKFKDQMQTVKERFELVHKGYEELTGARERQLDKQFTKIEELRSEQEIAIEPPVEEIFEEVAARNATRKIVEVRKYTAK